MKRLFVITRPDLADRTLLPAALVVALTLVAAVQLAGPRTESLPASRGAFVAPSLPDRVAGRIVPDPVLLADPLFTRSRGTIAKDVATGGPLGGAVPVGVTRTRIGARVVLQGEDGRPVSLAIGQAYNGWRVAGIARDGVRFARDGRTMTLLLSDGSTRRDDDTISQVADER